MPRNQVCFIFISILMLSGCSVLSDLAHVGSPPPLTPIRNPIQQSGYEPVSLPMPITEAETHQTNSLWRNGAKQFFLYQRAGKVGDILTVNISISDSAKLDNSTSRSRTGSESAKMPNLLGLETRLKGILPKAVDPSNLTSLSSDSANKGSGAIDRKETINTTVAAIVTQVLPNGNLVIQGRQEVRVNYEVRELLIGGIVRPEDISNTNTISQTQIAEARSAYGGRGELSRVQSPRYGQQAYDILMPF